MTPNEYLDRYTYLKFFSPHNFEQVPAGLTGYGAGSTRAGDCGTSGQIETERGAFTRALRMAHHGDTKTPCGEKFYFDKKPLGLIKPTEDFWGSTFFRAFLGKGSPDEIIDTLRVAMAIGRIGTGKDAAGNQAARPTAEAYVKNFITLDCNGLAGNYYGVNSDGHLSQFAKAAKKRTRAADVRVGDAIVTHCPEAEYEHVGLIQEWTSAGEDKGKVFYNVRIVEWGWHGVESVHFRDAKKHEIKQGPNKTFGVGFEAKSNRGPRGDKPSWEGKPTFRYIFAPPGDGQPLGWY